MTHLEDCELDFVCEKARLVAGSMLDRYDEGPKQVTLAELVAAASVGSDVLHTEIALRAAELILTEEVTR